MRSCDFQMLSWPVRYQTNDAIGILESFHEENTALKPVCLFIVISIREIRNLLRMTNPSVPNMAGYRELGRQLLRTKQWDFSSLLE